MSQALIIKGADFTDNALESITFQRKHATSISLSEDTLSFDAIGDTATLTATALPADHEDTIRWMSSDTNVATVSNGTITVVGVGTCNITVSAGSVSASCAVTVEIELTGYNKYVRTIMDAASATNRIVASDTMLNTSGTSYVKYMVMCNAESTYSGGLILDAYNMAMYDSESGRNVIPTDPATMTTKRLRLYNGIGYPLPIMLPSNCTKIRCIGLDGKYMPFPFFYQSTVPAYNEVTSDSSQGKASLQPYRELSDYTDAYVTNAENYTGLQTNEFDVPAGCDSIHVLWASDSDNGGLLFKDMTAEQLASFKIIAM